MAVYQTGIYIGSGLGLGIGGLIVARWDAAWAGTGLVPFPALHGHHTERGSTTTLFS